MQELAGETGQGQSCSNLAETGSAWQWRNRRLRGRGSFLQRDHRCGPTRSTAQENMSGQEREMEEDEGEGTSDTALMLPRRPPDCQAAALRSPRWAGLAAQGLGILLLPGRALAGLLLHLLLPAAVFLLVLLPAAAIVFLGFLCHSRACQESGAETRATEEKVSPAGGTYRRASRSTPSLAPRAARCSRIAALRRSSCRASSRFLRFWCSPRPPAPAWPDASARCCRPRLAVLDPAATWCPATMGASDATLTGRSSSAPGCDPRNISKGPQDLKSQRPLNSPRVPHKVAPGWRLRVCVQVPTWEIAGPHAAPCAVLRVAASRPPASSRGGEICLGDSTLYVSKTPSAAREPGVQGSA
ncbi:transmembrane protein 88B isoform X4 [Camelus bactrianus]|uniref:Transmembrane protein 88B isoform X4 n=1 Tax=Camelus bactrianus TaxID=9837 RepID=A0AC58RH44_CAMBA